MAMIPFRVGDVVKSKKDKQAHIIHEVKLDVDDEGVLGINYSTNLSAWHRHEDLTLLEPCSEKTLKILAKSIFFE